jgi:hypothetical protein
MSTDTRVIVGLSCVGAGLLHAFLLAWVIVLMQGEAQSNALHYLEMPVRWSWPGQEAPATDLRFFAFYGTFGSLFYGLVLGLPMGLTLWTARRIWRHLRRRP